MEFSAAGNCGPVSLFGGDGADTFQVGARATIQYYETQDTIKLLQEEGIVSTSITNLITTVLVDEVEVVDVVGVWDTNDLHMVLEVLFA